MMSSQVSQVKEVDMQEPVMLDQDMLDVDMLVWSSNSSQLSQDTEEKSCSFNTCGMSTCLAANKLPMRLVKCVSSKRFLV